MAHPRVGDGGDAFQSWRVATNMLNKKLRIADEGRSSSMLASVNTIMNLNILRKAGIF
jgi:hypothetical protein